ADPSNPREAGAGHDVDDLHRAGLAGLGVGSRLRAQGDRHRAPDAAPRGALRQQPPGAGGAERMDELPQPRLERRGPDAVWLLPGDARGTLRLPGLRRLGAPGPAAVRPPQRRLRHSRPDLRTAARARVRGAASTSLGLDGPPVDAVP